MSHTPLDPTLPATLSEARALHQVLSATSRLSPGSQVPPEILHHIFAYLEIYIWEWDPREPPRLQNTADFAALCLVSKAFLPVARAHLYRTIQLKVFAKGNSSPRRNPTGYSWFIPIQDEVLMQSRRGATDAKAPHVHHLCGDVHHENPQAVSYNTRNLEITTCAADSSVREAMGRTFTFLYSHFPNVLNLRLHVRYMRQQDPQLRPLGTPETQFALFGLTQAPWHLQSLLLEHVNLATMQRKEGAWPTSNVLDLAVVLERFTALTSLSIIVRGYSLINLTLPPAPLLPSITSLSIQSDPMNQDREVNSIFVILNLFPNLEVLTVGSRDPTCLFGQLSDCPRLRTLRWAVHFPEEACDVSEERDLDAVHSTLLDLPSTIEEIQLFFTRVVEVRLPVGDDDGKERRFDRLFFSDTLDFLPTSLQRITIPHCPAEVLEHFLENRFCPRLTSFSFLETRLAMRDELDSLDAIGFACERFGVTFQCGVKTMRDILQP